MVSSKEATLQMPFKIQTIWKPDYCKVWISCIRYYLDVPESKDVSGFEKQVVVAYVISMPVSANNKVNVIL